MAVGTGTAAAVVAVGLKAGAAWVAAGAVVTPGAKIGSGMLAVGVPARESRKLLPEEIELQRARTLRYVETARSHARTPPPCQPSGSSA